MRDVLLRNDDCSGVMSFMAVEPAARFTAASGGARGLGGSLA